MPDAERGNSESANDYARSRGFMPSAPDPTVLTTDAVRQAVEVSRREIGALRETLETRIDGMDKDRARLWEQVRNFPQMYETAAGHLRTELIQRDAHDREVLTQRLNDLDTAAGIASARIERIPADNATDAKALAADFRDSMHSEREYILGQINLARSETSKVSEVMLEKFEAVASTFASNALALTAALAAQKEAAAEANKSAALAISKSEAATQETIKSNAAQTQTGQQAISDILTDVKERVVRLETLPIGVRQATTEQRADRGENHNTIIAITMAISVVIAIVSFVAFTLKRLLMGIREVKQSELPKRFSCCGIISKSRIDLRNIPPKVALVLVNTNPGKPFTVQPIPVNTLVNR